MRDPLEGLTPDGIIRTGAHRSRIAAPYRAVLDRATSLATSHGSNISVYAYGSVATGAARAPTSDVDLLTIGLPADHAAEISRHLSTAFGDRCRGVEIAAARPHDLDGDGDGHGDGAGDGAGDEAYGFRVFLHHYCVHLAGPDRDTARDGFPGDRRAARGFNGDIARHRSRWRAELPTADAATLGRRVARKTLLAVAGLVSVHDATWTTDRDHAARRWSEIHPEFAPGLAGLLGWSERSAIADRRDVAERLTDTIDPIVEQFAARIGLWPD